MFFIFFQSLEPFSTPSPLGSSIIWYQSLRSVLHPLAQPTLSNFHVTHRQPVSIVAFSHAVLSHGISIYVVQVAESWNPSARRFFPQFFVQTIVRSTIYVHLHRPTRSARAWSLASRVLCILQIVRVLQQPITCPQSQHIVLCCKSQPSTRASSQSKRKVSPSTPPILLTVFVISKIEQRKAFHKRTNIARRNYQPRFAALIQINSTHHNLHTTPIAPFAFHTLATDPSHRQQPQVVARHPPAMNLAHEAFLLLLNPSIPHSSVVTFTKRRRLRHFSK